MDGGSTGCFTNTYGECLEQAGWVLSSLGGNSANIVYVDFSKTGNFNAIPTTIEWKEAYTSDIQGEIDCSQGPGNYTIILQNGTNTATHTTDIGCSTAQNKLDLTDNSVFFESADNDTTQNWPSDITGSVSASSATEAKNSINNPVSWSSSHNVDIPCTGYAHLFASKVITGSLDSSGSATWSSLNKQPHAC